MGPVATGCQSRPSGERYASFCVVARNSLPVQMTHWMSARAPLVALFWKVTPSFVTASRPFCPPMTNTPLPNATRRRPACLSTCPAICVTVILPVAGSNAVTGPKSPELTMRPLPCAEARIQCVLVGISGVATSCHFSASVVLKTLPRKSTA
jgi:hypothetical protein